MGIKGLFHHPVILVSVFEDGLQLALITIFFRNHTQRTWAQLANPSTDLNGEIYLFS